MAGSARRSATGGSAVLVLRAEAVRDAVRSAAEWAALPALVTPCLAKVDAALVGTDIVAGGARLGRGLERSPRD